MQKRLTGWSKGLSLVCSPVAPGSDVKKAIGQRFRGEGRNDTPGEEWLRMGTRSSLGVPTRYVVLLFCVAAAWLLATVLAPAAQAQGQTKRILLYTGTTGFRHSDAINNGRPVVQAAIEQAGYTVDWEDCTNNGGAAGNCDNADKNPRIFTD